MKAKTWLITISIVILVVAAIIIVIFSHKNVQISPSSSNPFASTTAGVKTGEEAPTTIRAKDGSLLKVPNFTADKEPQMIGSDTYYQLVHSGPVFGNEKDYNFEIQYEVSNSYFHIFLLTEPLGTARQQAESFLKQALQLSNSDLCNLNLQVTVTQDVNAQYSDKGDLKLSFCPGAVQLPD